MLDIRSSNRLLGALFFGFSLCCLFLWIPYDIDTGWIETVRRRNVIGDSLAPAMAVILIAFATLIDARPQNEELFKNEGKRWFFCRRVASPCL